MSTKILMSGHFTLIATSKERGSRIVADFDNLILDQGLDRIAVGNCIGYCQIGTGSTTPAVGQTGLVSLSAASSDTSTVADVISYVSGATPYTQLIRNYRYSAGVATGTFSEIGVGWSNTGSTLFSRALILDSGGSPTSITILSDEVLDVKYTFRLYSPTTDVTGTTTIGGDSYTYILRAADIDNTSIWNPSAFLATAIMSPTFAFAAYAFESTATLGSTTGTPTGSSVYSAAAPVHSTYVPGSFTQNYEATWGLTENPTGGVKVATFLMSYGGGNSGGMMQMSFSPFIPKDNTKVLKLKVAATWARV